MKITHSNVDLQSSFALAGWLMMLNEPSHGHRSGKHRPGCFGARFLGALATYLLSGLLSIASAAENARVTVLLHEVPVAPEVAVQLHVSWAAHSPEIKAALQKRYDFRSDRNRSSGTIRYVTETIQIEDSVKSLLAYGRILTSDGETLRVIPAKLFETSDFNSLSQIQIEITPRDNFNKAFIDSYPLEFERDEGFLTTENVRPILRSFRLMIDYAGETDSQVSTEVWTRVHTFFQVNRGFFRTGGSAELSDILSYLRSYVAASRAQGVANFYAEFLNGLIVGFGGREVFNSQDLTEYIHSQLLQLYETRIEETFNQLDISLQKFHEIRFYDKCLTIASTALHALDEDSLVHIIRSSPRNLFSVLVQTTVCGQDHFAENSGWPGANRNLSDDAARFLAQTDIGRTTMEGYLRVCRVMEREGLLSLNSTGRAAEVSKFFIAYNSALAGS